MKQSPRQTLGYLRDLFEARGLRPKGKLGQCFLVDLNLMDLIVRCAALSTVDLVIEVGTGTGSLTTRLADRAGQVLGVEIDPGFSQLTEENTAEFDNVTLVRGDILRRKNQINPAVLEAVASLLQKPGIRQAKLIANLPYVVATPVITNFLLTDIPFERMVVTIQWELGARLVAEPSTSDYGALSVMVQSLCDVEIVRRMPPHAFWPRPAVDSAIVMIRPNAAKRAAIRDLQQFHGFVRDLYLHRRKNLRGALLPMVREQLTKEELDQTLIAHGFDPNGRAEALAVEAHRQLWEVLSAGSSSSPNVASMP